MSDGWGTTYITVACVSDKRWFDLDSERTPLQPHTLKYPNDLYADRPNRKRITNIKPDGEPERWDDGIIHGNSNPAGAPPLDCWFADKLPPDPPRVDPLERHDMSEARFVVGDVFTEMAKIPDGTIDLIVTSPPFLALRSYLPADHPDKHLEIGSEATPAAFLSTLLRLTGEWRRILAPHGSLCVELGDTHSGSGPGAGWPLDKSLCLIPTSYAFALAYGHNPHNPDDTIEPWRVRNLIVWHRPNPPVGALGDKVRPSTSYVTVACTSQTRWFDLDAERQPYAANTINNGKVMREGIAGNGPKSEHQDGSRLKQRMLTHDGAPPLDAWFDTPQTAPPSNTHRRTAKGVTSVPRTGKSSARGGNWASMPELGETRPAPPLDMWTDTPQADVWTIPTAPYPGAHYATFPPALPRKLINLMCPRQVCTTCGEPRRRITSAPTELHERHEAFAETVRAARQQHGMSQRDVDGHFGFNGMCSHWERRINGDQSQPAYPTPEQWTELRRLLSIETPDFDDLIGGYRRFSDEQYTDEYRQHIERTRELGFYASTGNDGMARVGVNGPSVVAQKETLGWSDCGHNTWRRGVVLDPFVGSGTTLQAASELGRDSIGIDLDPRNLDLARARLGMFLMEEADAPL